VVAASNDHKRGSPPGQRFIGSGDFYWMSDGAKMLK
jgi:hypothetical protein